LKITNILQQSRLSSTINILLDVNVSALSSAKYFIILDG